MFALCHSFCYYLNLSLLELRLRYMHYLGALLRVHTFHCCEKCVTVKLWIVRGVNIDEVNCSLFHMVSWGFEGRRNVNPATWINLYVHFVVYLFKYEF